MVGLSRSMGLAALCVPALASAQINMPKGRDSSQPQPLRPTHNGHLDCHWNHGSCLWPHYL